ncbi:MAG: Bifunctional ribokinase/ribose-5-phosphate isomerase A [Fimbriimonadaceae bacterium]|nr:Bifunctional ribokinase/ribose-5-phosphate isomerase A [Fimbriimonadaceae bacterium]
MTEFRAGNVLVVGSANADLVARVERFPCAGETVIGLGFEVHPGGKGANQAVAAARFGADATFVGCLGADAHADLLRRSLLESGANIAHIQVASDRPTGTAVILVDSSGQNQIVVVPGANHTIDASRIPIENLARGGATAMLVQLEIPTEAVNLCLARAKDAGMTTILNPAPITNFEGLNWSAVDVAVPNESEAGRLWSVASERGYRGTTIVTRGKEGFELHLPNEEKLAMQAPDVDAVDSTGAGDCFCGVVAALWNQSDDKLGVCEIAMMAASLSVTRRGAQPSMPSYSEVKGFVESL